ncbi:MAG: DUF4331 domain-containing protein [Thiohalocapsa sp.]
MKKHWLSIRMPILPAALLAFAAGNGWAASHSDAPLIKQDPQANITDVYAFVGRSFANPTEQVLNVIVQVRPFSEPGDGVIYDRFADDARYSIHIAHPTTGETLMRYDFAFSNVNPSTPPGLKNSATILSYGLGTEVGSIASPGDARQNYSQTFNVTRTVDAAATSIGTDKRKPPYAPRRPRTTTEIIGTRLLTPPPNVGLRTTPLYNDATTGRAVSGATTQAELDVYTRQSIYTLPSGETVFAGPREDGFYADIPGVFDLLDPRILDNDDDLGDGLGQDGGGVDGFKGFNVLAFAVQIPLVGVPSFAYTAPFADLAQPLPASGEASGVGVYASVSRRSTRVLRQSRDPINVGRWVQVNRMGNPLFNELLVALADKDNYNRTAPTVDLARFATYAENPEAARLINLVFQTDFGASDRGDLAAVFIPDVIRVDTTTEPVPLAGESDFNRLGFIGGDTTSDDAGRVKSSGWPNGRRFGDDVIDIALTALASGPTYAAVTLVGDNVAANDQLYHQVFPYSGTPHAGPTNRKDP